MKTLDIFRSTTFVLNQVYVSVLTLAALITVLCFSSCASEYCEVNLSTKATQLSFGLYYFTDQQESEGVYSLSYDKKGRLLSSNLNGCDAFVFTYDNSTSSVVATSMGSQQSTKVILNSMNLPVFMDDNIFRYTFDHEGRLTELTVSNEASSTSFSFTYNDEDLPEPYHHISYSPHMFSKFVGTVAGQLLSNRPFEYLPKNCVITQKDSKREEHYELSYKMGADGFSTTLYKCHVENGQVVGKSIKGLSCYSIP